MLKSYCDGACRCSNPGQTSCAFAVYEGDRVIAEGSRYLGPDLRSNNFAEYQGLLDLLKWAEVNTVRGLTIYCDSQLVIKTTKGEWNLNVLALQPLRDLAYALLTRGGHTLEHVKGHSGVVGNERVDFLCNEVLDKEGIGKC